MKRELIKSGMQYVTKDGTIVVVLDHLYWWCQLDDGTFRRSALAMGHATRSNGLLVWRSLVSAAATEEERIGVSRVRLPSMVGAIDEVEDRVNGWEHARRLMIAHPNGISDVHSWRQDRREEAATRTWAQSMRRNREVLREETLRLGGEFAARVDSSLVGGIMEEDDGRVSMSFSEFAALVRYARASRDAARAFRVYGRSTMVGWAPLTGSWNHYKPMPLQDRIREWLTYE